MLDEGIKSPHIYVSCWMLIYTGAQIEPIHTNPPLQQKCNLRALTHLLPKDNPAGMLPKLFEISQFTLH
jgi:hypothetical protein